MPCGSKRRMAGFTMRRFLEDFPVVGMSDIWTDAGVAGFASDKKYVVVTSTKVVERCVLMTTDPGDANFIDPTCGSGTTAYVAEQSRHGSLATPAALHWRWRERV